MKALGIINYETFLIAGIILNITPGADTLYIMSRSISQGTKAGIFSVLGIISGAIGHIILASLGLSIILAQSAMAFQIVKYLGAAYLIFMGIKSIISSSKSGLSLNSKPPQRHRKIYISGVFTNLLNPKVALFFLAFLPQFIDHEHSESPAPFLILGLTFLTTGTIWCVIVAVFAGRLSEKFRQNPKIKTWLDRVSGTIFIALGIKLALTKN
ncbi:LysE family translocator [Fulvivirga maritima]|uniref:LysE family translocator n=1 Tax=Fulvivirga maritima TaxID=2904247 RepID=UPI001F21FC3B|nr:LysE family translocator [Fulvivirga maritima]UII28280.1 LysE family translocator [Fulvivirga maritima]